MAVSTAPDRYAAPVTEADAHDALHVLIAADVRVIGDVSREAIAANATAGPHYSDTEVRFARTVLHLRAAIVALEIERDALRATVALWVEVQR